MYLFGALALAAGSFATAATACPDWTQTGQILRYSSDQLYAPQTHSVVAGGQNNLNNCPQPGTGYVATRPDFDLTFSNNGMGRDLEIRVNASCDSVLLVNDARGQWHFDDDGGDGLNSRLRISNAPEGTYDIWVGTYGPSTCQATMTLETFNAGGLPPPQPPQPPQQPAACPNPAANGQMLTYSGQGLWTPQRFNVVAGGNIDLGACQTVPGHGHIVQSPDFTLNFTANPQNYDLEFRVEGTCDPVLLVNSPSGQWFYNDDDNGLNSRLRIPRAQAGQYDIWVGTFGSQTCQATLIAETFGGQVTPPPPPPQPVVCPDPSIPTNERSYSAAQLATAQSFSDVAGGNVDLGACQAVSGHGHITQRANHTFILTDNPQNGNLEFRVSSSCDPVLLVYGPNGQWHYNDDSNGLNPRLTIAGAAPGAYDVWVGTFGSQTCNVTLEAQMTGIAPPQPGGVTFPQAYWNGEAVDWCLNYGANCGQPAADRFCQLQGYSNAVNGGWGQTTVGRTLVIGDNRICTGACGQLVNVVCAGTAQPPQPSVLPDPGNLTGYRDRVGQTFSFQVTGAAQGSVWGTNVYTDDSSVARAAVHAGVLQVGQSGVVQVTILPGQQTYQGSTQNGVQSSGYGSWSGSYSFVQQGATVQPGSIASRLVAVQPSAGRDFVGRGDGMTPNGNADGLYRIGVSAPGQVVTGIEVRNTDGAYSVWDTQPNGFWSAAVVMNGQLMNQANGTVNFPLGQGETVLDLYCENNGAIGNAGMAITVSFASGQQTVVTVPSGFVGGDQPGPQPGQTPAADGQWRINANGWAGTLELDWTGFGWSGTVTFDAYAQQETLQDITFNPGTGAITFTRPIPGATQMYRGVLANGQLSGQFNQNGGGYDFTWSATRSSPAPSPAPTPAPQPAPGK